MDLLQSGARTSALLTERLCVDGKTEFTRNDMVVSHEDGSPCGKKHVVLNTGRVQWGATRLLLGAEKGKPIIMSLLGQHDPDLSPELQGHLVVEAGMAEVLAEMDWHRARMDQLFGPTENHLASYVCDVMPGQYAMTHRIGVRGDEKEEWQFFWLRYFVLWNRMNEAGDDFAQNPRVGKACWLLAGLTKTYFPPNAATAAFAVCVPEGATFPRITLPSPFEFSVEAMVRSINRASPGAAVENPRPRRRRGKGAKKKKAAKAVVSAEAHGAAARGQSEEEDDDECPICMSCIPDLHTACCSKPMCLPCFRTVRAIRKKMSFSCPFCRAEPFQLL